MGGMLTQAIQMEIIKEWLELIQIITILAIDMRASHLNNIEKITKWTSLE